MKIKYSRIIPFKGFYAINLFGTYVVRKEYEGEPIEEYILNHEAIHTDQIKEMGYIPFYLWYFIEWLIRLLINGRYAYYMISFEQEARDNQYDKEYLINRKPYSWLKYYGKK